MKDELILDEIVTPRKKWNLPAMLQFWKEEFIRTSDPLALQAAEYLQSEIDRLEELALQPTPEAFHEVRKWVRGGYLPAEVLGVMLEPIVAPEAMKAVCAWCSRTMRPGVAPVTHGICTSCAEVIFQ